MDIQEINVKISGLSDILFNRFYDHSKEERPPEQKLYIMDKNILVLPSMNLDAFLFGQNPAGCAKKFEGKKGKDYICMGMAHINIAPIMIPFLDDNDKPIRFNGFEDDKFWILQQGGRTPKGSISVKQEAQKRPAMKLPWILRFKVILIKNNLIDSTKLYNWFVAGGIQIAIGAYRPKFGRFEVIEWDD